jgi:hypothetical protein
MRRLAGGHEERRQGQRLGATSAAQVAEVDGIERYRT